MPRTQHNTQHMQPPAPVISFAHVVVGLDLARRCGQGGATLPSSVGCATLMHLQGVPVAVIAAWIGHKDASLTMRLYAHSQFAALQDAGASLDRVVTSCDTEPRGHAR
jgi:hypothetical protein